LSLDDKFLFYSETSPKSIDKSVPLAKFLEKDEAN
jgi:hypothetical protein